MSLQDAHRLVVTRAALAIGAIAVATVFVTAQAPPQNAAAPAKASSVVDVSALEPLLPAPAGWTKIRSNTRRVDVSSDCAYSLADAVFMNGEMKVRITVADSGRNADSLLILASMVVTFPDNYTETVAKATITRLRFNDAPAATRWDGEKKEGEFTVLVGGRFVATADGTNVDSLDTLRTLVGQIDLKRLGDLK
jgi:hypothetical protein